MLCQRLTLRSICQDRSYQSLVKSYLRRFERDICFMCVSEAQNSIFWWPIFCAQPPIEFRCCQSLTCQDMWTTMFSDAIKITKRIQQSFARSSRLNTLVSTDKTVNESGNLTSPEDWFFPRLHVPSLLRKFHSIFYSKILTLTPSVVMKILHITGTNLTLLQVEKSFVTVSKFALLSTDLTLSLIHI